MQTNVLEYLENTWERVPGKTAYANDTDAVTFKEVYDNARSIGTYLGQHGHYAEPVVVFMQKHPNAIISFYGVVYAGCSYVPIDEEMPRHRIGLIFDSLKPRAIICDDVTEAMVREFDYQGDIYKYADICHNMDASRLKEGKLPPYLAARYRYAKQKVAEALEVPEP